MRVLPTPTPGDGSQFGAEDMVDERSYIAHIHYAIAVDVAFPFFGNCIVDGFEAFKIDGILLAGGGGGFSGGSFGGGTFSGGGSGGSW